MTDREVVDRILRHRQTNLFAQVVGKYGGMVFSKALGITKQAETAKEIAQQTFVRAYSRLDDWHGQELGPWLVAIACHLSLNHLERERRRPQVGLAQVQLPAEEYSDERERRLSRVEQAIALLPAADRDLIRLHYYKQRKTAEIAQALGLSQANVLVRLHRIRERIKKQLQHGNDPL